jgi:hypothetical protein
MGKSITQKNTKRTAKKRAVLRESTHIINFITAISSKKYALAHKYLQGAVQSKIQRRIESSLNKPLF